jgi:hypothetical protein
MGALHHILPADQLNGEKRVLKETHGFEPSEAGVILHCARAVIEDVAKRTLEQT